MFFRRSLIAIAGFLLAGVVQVSVATPGLTFIDWAVFGTGEPGVSHRSAASILVDTGSRFVLYADNAHRILPAASLTKVVAIHAAMDAVREGAVDLDEGFSPRPETWAQNQAPGSSLMFLGPAQTVTIRDLLPGLAVSSGNDAAMALALRVSGSVPAFTERMNRVVRELGLQSSSFVEPSGLDPFNMITAAEYAEFAQFHIETYPGLIEEVYSLTSFTYPREQHVVGDEAPVSIRQTNRNSLVGSYPGADGLKTGFIDESGYHLAATAERDGRRLIAIVLGIEAPTHEEGARLRAEEAAALLDYGFHEFESLEFGTPPLAPVTVFKGRSRSVPARAPERIAVSIPAGSRNRLTGQVEYATSMVAPVPAGTTIGTIRVELDGLTLAEKPIVVDEVLRGGLLRRLWDSLRLFFRRIRGDEEPMTLP